MKAPQDFDPSALPWLGHADDFQKWELELAEAGVER